MIDLGYTPQQRQLYDSIVRFAERELNGRAAEYDKEQRFAADEWTKCGAMKLQGLCAPARCGGLGLDPVSTAVALEALGYGCTDGGLAFSIAAHLLSCVVPLALHGSEAQKNQFLEGMASGRLIAANAITEAGSGSDAFSMQTTARKDGDRYVINGVKTYISNAPVADVLVLYASTNADKGFHGGISAFIIDKNLPGINCSAPFDKLGLRSCMMGELRFDHVIVPRESLLAGEGAGAMLFSESMHWERALLGAIHVGAMQRLVQQCAQHVKSRYIRGTTIAAHQAVAFRLADMATLTEAARLMVYKAAFELQHNPRTCTQAVSAAKLFVSEALNTVCKEALGIFGASGYLTGSPVERCLRDAAAATIYSGTSDIQKNMIGSWLGL